jgi:hypothetical protein
MGVENNIAFGSGTFYIDASKIGAIEAMKVTEYSEDRHFKGMAFTTASTAEFECEVDGPLLSELAGLDSDPTFKMEYDGIMYEQVRKHKKKRINKKWAKRYGYREVPCHINLENARVITDSENGFVVVSELPVFKRKRG